LELLPTVAAARLATPRPSRYAPAMCNDYGNRIPYGRYVEAFGELKVPVFVEGNGPDLTPRDDIRIRDTAPVILRTSDGVQLPR